MDEVEVRLIGRKVRGVVTCLNCETPAEKKMAGYFLIAGRSKGFACERCGKPLEEARDVV